MNDRLSRLRVVRTGTYDAATVARMLRQIDEEVAAIGEVIEELEEDRDFYERCAARLIEGDV